MYKTIKNLNYEIYNNFIIKNKHNRDKKICLIMNDYDYHHLHINEFYNNHTILYIIKLNNHDIYRKKIKHILDLYNIKWNFIIDHSDYNKTIINSDTYMTENNKPFVFLLRRTKRVG